MSQQSVLARVFDPKRRRRSPRVAGSVSDFVVQLPEAGVPLREAAQVWRPAPPSPPPAPESDARLALQALRARQLEAENLRLKRMAGDLMLEKEILQATMRRRVLDSDLLGAA